MTEPVEDETMCFLQDYRQSLSFQRESSSPLRTLIPSFLVMDEPKETTKHYEGDIAAHDNPEKPVDLTGDWPKVDDMLMAAEAAALREKNMSIMDALKAYPKAIAYSMILSLCLVMEGYDTSLTDAFFSLPQFRRRFGEPLADGDYQITSSWMSGLKNGVQVGQILGLMAAGMLAERYGYKKTIIGSLMVLIGFIFIFFFASHIAMLFTAGVLCGVPWVCQLSVV